MYEQRKLTIHNFKYDIVYELFMLEHGILFNGAHIELCSALLCYA